MSWLVVIGASKPDMWCAGFRDIVKHGSGSNLVTLAIWPERDDNVIKLSS